MEFSPTTVQFPFFLFQRHTMLPVRVFAFLLLCPPQSNAVQYITIGAIDFRYFMLLFGGLVVQSR